ncbi:MAG TPA: hypothetical protein VJH95_04995 [Candidatus Nanoarchaeia archaeon]|nr:hypothetical protein [Candidatus Nanoarchaeia archaeon]
MVEVKNDVKSGVRRTKVVFDETHQEFMVYGEIAEGVVGLMRKLGYTASFVNIMDTSKYRVKGRLFEAGRINLVNVYYDEPATFIQTSIWTGGGLRAKLDDYFKGNEDYAYKKIRVDEQGIKREA